VNNCNNINFKCDTGAQVNVLSLKELKTVVNDDNNLKLSETTIVLEVFGGARIIPEGKINLKLTHNDVCYNTEFIIIKQNVKAILGLSSLLELKLLNTVNDIKCNKTNSNNKNAIINNYHELFQGVGKFEKPLQLHTQPGVEPVVRPPRRVPNALQARLAEKLKSLEERQIITRVDHPKSFVSNLVIIEKKDKSLRICLDPKDLNNVLVREYHIIPTLEEIIPKLTNKNFFSVLDLSEGFYNIVLDDKSSDLCTFNSPMGCYKFNRLPFGVSVASEIFQKYNERAFGDIPGVIIYCDDLLICADTEVEHDAILTKVFERAKQHNVRFNKNKFQYKLNEVKYFGHIFSNEGMRIDPDRVIAINNIKSPSNKKELQIFLGMVNYLRKFIPNLAKIASPLQLLLKKNVGWLWTTVHENSFNNIKMVITKAPVLQNFNVKEPVVIQCDASKDGLGCCLLQNGKPVSFASRSLTPSEQNFSQIEKELLSVVWATKKFHYYIYGQKCTILNDHKPLETLLKKHIHEVPSPRLQRLKLKLLKYDIHFKYLKGKFMYIADLLSRAYLKCTDIDESYMYDVIHCVGLANYMQCTVEQKQIIISETCKDEELSQLLNYTKNGWPENSKQICDNVQYYYKFRADITIDDNLLFLNHRLIIPKALRLDIIKKLHEGHLGMTKMKQSAREMYYWPKIDDHIEKFVRQCIICQTYQNSNTKEPLLPHNIPDLPFSKLGIDIMDFKSKSYLVIYDYFSKWLDFKLISNKSSKSIINTLIDIFCIFGIPKEIVSDHIPFDSRECKEFATNWDFKFTYSSPRYSQSNGMAERAVQIAKKILIKCNEDKSDFRLALLQYRSSPVCGTNFSPAELLMNRKLKTKLPVTYNYLKPKLNNNVKTELSKTVARNIKNYNSNTKYKQGFVMGQHIWFKKDVNVNKWLQGKIVKNNGLRSYDVLDNNNVRYTRTSYHIRPW
jgi:hypothetical protein